MGFFLQCALYRYRYTYWYTWLVGNIHAKQRYNSWFDTPDTPGLPRLRDFKTHGFYLYIWCTLLFSLFMVTRTCFGRLKFIYQSSLLGWTIQFHYLICILMPACELSKKHFLKSSFFHMWFIYLLKIKAILQLSLHMTPNADIFCIIVPHWSHGATQSPSWFWIFWKCFISLWTCSYHIMKMHGKWKTVREVLPRSHFQSGYIHNHTDYTCSAPYQCIGCLDRLNTMRWALMRFLSNNQNWTCSCISQ